jgi:hypothetical protein
LSKVQCEEITYFQIGMAPASGYGSFPGQTYTPPGSGGPIPSYNGGGRGGYDQGGQPGHYQPGGPAAREFFLFFYELIDLDPAIVNTIVIAF